jgi:hypothetical protein
MDRENRKAVLAADVQSAIDALGWTSAQAAATLDVPEERLAEALAGSVRWLDEWTLEDWLARLRAESALGTDAETAGAVRAGLRLDCTPGRFRTPVVFIEAVRRRPRHLRFVPETQRTPELCLAACRRNGAALEWVPERLKTPDLCLLAVRNHGTALRHVPEPLWTAEMCREAVFAAGFALCWVPEPLKTAELCAEAVKSDGWALKAVPEELKTEELCMEAVRRTGKALEFVPEALKSEDLCRQAVKADRKALLVTPLEVVDRIASEWPAGWDPAAELAWGARRSAAIEGRITREQAEKHGVDQSCRGGRRTARPADRAGQRRDSLSLDAPARNAGRRGASVVRLQPRRQGQTALGNEGAGSCRDCLPGGYSICPALRICLFQASELQRPPSMAAPEAKPAKRAPQAFSSPRATA